MKVTHRRITLLHQIRATYQALVSIQNAKEGWWCCSVVEHLLNDGDGLMRVLYRTSTHSFHVLNMTLLNIFWSSRHVIKSWVVTESTIFKTPNYYNIYFLCFFKSHSIKKSVAPSLFSSRNSAIVFILLLLIYDHEVMDNLFVLNNECLKNSN